MRAYRCVLLPDETRPFSFLYILDQGDWAFSTIGVLYVKGVVILRQHHTLIFLKMEIINLKVIEQKIMVMNPITCEHYTIQTISNNSTEHPVLDPLYT